MHVVAVHPHVVSSVQTFHNELIVTGEKIIVFKYVCTITLLCAFAKKIYVMHLSIYKYNTPCYLQEDPDTCSPYYGCIGLEVMPTLAPVPVPTQSPSFNPSVSPSDAPTTITSSPTYAPSRDPTPSPSKHPTQKW